MDIPAMIQQFCIPIIVVVCYCIGFAIKKTGIVKANYIPLIMIVIGGISGVLMNGISYEAVAMGIVSGAASTGLNQVYKQLTRDDEYSI